MSQLINSGIIYLEQFVDDTNLLPADLTRSLDYIRTLDERILGIKEDSTERLKQFIAQWHDAPSPLPGDAREQHDIIDGLHAEIIHLQEEKNVFAAQIEEMLRATLSKLERQQSALTSGLSVSEPAPEVYADTRSAYGLSMHQSVSHSGAHQAQVAHPYATAQSMQRQHMHPAAPHEMEYRAMYPGAQGEMMQGASNSGSIPMIAIPSRKPTPKSMRPASIAEQQHSLQSMQSMHLQHAPPAMAATWQGVHPQHMQQMPRHPSPAQAAALPAHMMPQYLPPGMPMHGHGMYGYAPQHPQMHMPHDPAMAGMPAQYFMPVDASFKDSSSRPQARNGKVLTQADIQNSLVGKQAELLWPDDGLWYLIKITAVNLMESTADIIYLTGETEAGLNLEDIAIKKEMRIIPG